LILHIDQSLIPSQIIAPLAAIFISRYLLDETAVVRAFAILTDGTCTGDFLDWASLGALDTTTLLCLGRVQPITRSRHVDLVFIADLNNQYQFYRLTDVL
jgi:hypothetical protein